MRWQLILVSCCFFTKFHKHSGLRQYKFILLPVLEVRSLKAVRRAVFLLRLWGGVHSLSFQLLEVACMPWLVAPHHSNSASVITSLSLTLTPCLPLVRTLVINYIGPSPPPPHDPGYSSHFKIPNFITSSKSLLPRKLAYSQVLGIRMWTSLGGVAIT